MSNELVAFLITIGTGLFGSASVALGKLISQVIQKKGMELMNSKWKEVETVVDISVKATEQMYLVAKRSGEEFDRKTFAMGLVKEALTRRKIKDITDADIDPLIEAKVLNMTSVEDEEPSKNPTIIKEPPEEDRKFGMGRGE